MVRSVWLGLLVACQGTPSTGDGGDPPQPDTDAADTEVEGPDDPGPTTVAVVQVALGETLFLGGDDLLAAWGAGDADAVALVAAPAGARAAVVDGRLTPDVPGTWTLQRGAERIDVAVEEDFLSAETFVNLNYSPTEALLAWDEDTLWVASPPSNAIQEVTTTPDGLVAGAQIPTGAWPTALARWGDLLLVSQTGRDGLGLVDPALGRVVDAIPVGDEPAGIVVDGDVAWVALSGPGEVARVDLVARRVTARLAVGREPKALAFDPTRRRLFAASQLSSNAHPMGTRQVVAIPEAQQRDVHVIDVDAVRVVGAAQAVGTILRGMLVDGDRLLVATSEAHNDRARVDADSHPVSHHLVSIALDGPPVVTERVALGAHPGAAGPVPSPFSLLRVGDAVWVTASASQELVALDATTWAEQARVPVGADPRGLVAVGSDLITYAWLDGVVQRVSGGAVAASVAVGRDPTPDRVRRGQRLFSDARFSRYGEFSCNSCHVDGVTDGLTWDLLLDGPVNTLAFRNVGGTGPFLWGGFLPTLFDFSREVLRLVGAEATGEQMELLNTYMQSVTAPPNPHTLPGGRLTAAGQRGRDLFDGRAGCAACHPAPLYSSLAVVPGKTQGLPTDVPSLIGAWDSGPWGRQGQWVTLPAMVDVALAYTGADLTDGERADLVAFVQQLPGDALYVTSVSPLEGSEHVWPGTPVEVAFSGLIAPGQEALLRIEQDAGGGWAPVPGAWTVSGRYARFRLDSGRMADETRYRVTVEGGLKGALGTALAAPLVLSFGTGTPPDVDLSGTWRLDVDGFAVGSIEMGFVQSRGGQVTGARTDSGGLIDFDHIQGFVSGEDFVARDFVAVLAGLEVQVTEMDVAMLDDDADGYADRGAGTVSTAFADLSLSMTRLTLPAAP